MDAPRLLLPLFFTGCFAPFPGTGADPDTDTDTDTDTDADADADTDTGFGIIPAAVDSAWAVGDPDNTHFTVMATGVGDVVTVSLSGVLTRFRPRPSPRRRSSC